VNVMQNIHRLRVATQACRCARDEIGKLQYELMVDRNPDQRGALAIEQLGLSPKSFIWRAAWAAVDVAHHRRTPLLTPRCSQRRGNAAAARGVRRFTDKA
jgi:hypothetical protein